MTGNPQVLEALQAALPLEAQLNLQYRHDWRTLKFMGVKKTAKRVHCLGDEVHRFMKQVDDRILILGGSAAYAISGPISEQASVTAILQNELALEMGIVTPYERAVQTCVQALDDTTRNLFEHLLKWHQQSIAWLEQQLRLIQGLGEDEYIAEKL